MEEAWLGGRTACQQGHHSGRGRAQQLAASLRVTPLEKPVAEQPGLPGSITAPNPPETCYGAWWRGAEPFPGACAGKGKPRPHLLV